jgi:hypothetical protein
MPIGDFFRVLRRRWAVVLVGFLLTVGLSGAAYWFFKPTYEITGTVLLLPPPSSAVNGSTNPYLQLGGLQQTVDLVGVSLTDQTTTLDMQGISKEVEYTVKADVRTSSPLLLIDVKTSSAETAVKIRDILVASVPVRLDALQESLNVSTKDRVTSKVLTMDTEALEVGKNRLRAAVVAGVLGLALTLVVAALWDARSLRHPRRRAARVDTTPASAVVPLDESANVTLAPEPANAIFPLDEPADAISALDEPADAISAPDEPADAISAPDEPADAISAPDEPADAISAPDEPANAFFPPDEPVDSVEEVFEVPASQTSPQQNLETIEDSADASIDARR